MKQQINPSRHPCFMDVTLRDGNQALARPMTLEQKLQVFAWLKQLGVRHTEVGYPAASDMDFKACQAIGRQAPRGMTISVLARCNQADIACAIRALKSVKSAKPRLHIFIGMSQFHMEHVLKKTAEEVRAIAIAAVRQAKAGLKRFKAQAEIQFSPEHFGDCQGNLDWVIETLKQIAAAGAGIINLPNTVERTRPAIFAGMVQRVVAALPKSVIVSAHCHNDLGMATATTVESYFAGARQLEVTLNGLGERAGNANLCEVVLALYSAGVPTKLKLARLYQTALEISGLTRVPIPLKAPVIGEECLCHRSGIHQHGAVRTLQRVKGAYRAYDPALVGRAGDEALLFTSQSGYTAVAAILGEAGHLISDEEARILQPALKAAAEAKGELTTEEIAAVYLRYKELKASKLKVDHKDILAIALDVVCDRGQQTWRRVSARVIAGEYPVATITLGRNGNTITKTAEGDGPVNAAFEAIRQITGLTAVVQAYHIENVSRGADSLGKVTCGLKLHGRSRDGTSTGPDIVLASIDAYLGALNQLLASKNRAGR